MKKKLFVVYFTLVLALVSSCASLSRYRARDNFEQGMALFNQGRFAVSVSAGDPVYARLKADSDAAALRTLPVRLDVL